MMCVCVCVCVCVSVSVSVCERERESQSSTRQSDGKGPYGSACSLIPNQTFFWNWSVLRHPFIFFSQFLPQWLNSLSSRRAYWCVIERCELIPCFPGPLCPSFYHAAFWPALWTSRQHGSRHRKALSEFTLSKFSITGQRPLLCWKALRPHLWPHLLCLESPLSLPHQGSIPALAVRGHAVTVDWLSGGDVTPSNSSHANPDWGRQKLLVAAAIVAIMSCIWMALCHFHIH